MSLPVYRCRICGAPVRQKHALAMPECPNAIRPYSRPLPNSLQHHAGPRDMEPIDWPPKEMDR